MAKRSVDPASPRCHSSPSERFQGEEKADIQLTNLATPNWTGLIENDGMKQVAVDTLREYGVGTCGPSGFYGTIGEYYPIDYICSSALALLFAISD